MKVHYDEGLAIHIGPKPCAYLREKAGEASAGECTGQPLSVCCSKLTEGGSKLTLSRVNMLLER